MSRSHVLTAFAAGVFSLVIALIASSACSLAYPLSGYSSAGEGIDPKSEGGASSGTTGEGGLEGGNSASSSSSSAGGPPPLLVYAEGDTTIHARRYIPSSNTWSPPVVGPRVDDGRVISWVVPRRRGGSSGGPTIVGVYSARPDRSLGKLEIFETADGASFTRAFESSDFVSTPTGGTPARRAFDIAFESASGRAIAVYGGANPFLPKLRIRAPDGTWSPERNILNTGPNDVAFLWHELVARPGTDDLILLSVDRNNKLYGTLWLPKESTFAEPELLADPIQDDNYRAFAAAYESKSGDLLIVWAASERMFYVTVKPNEKLPTKASARLLDTARTGVITLAPDPTSDRIAMSMLEIVCGASTCDDFSTWLWNGDGFTGALTTIDTDIGESFSDRDGSQPIAIGWSGDQAIAPYFRSGPSGGGFRWSRYRGDTQSWTTNEPEAVVSPPIPNKASFAVFRSGESDVVFVISDVKGSLWAKRYDGKTWSDTEGGSALAVDLPTNKGVPFGVDF